MVAELEAIAPRLDDPVTLSQALQRRVLDEVNADRLDVADVLADEALHWARTAGDEWEIAEASRGKAIAASTVAELRERDATRSAARATPITRALDSRYLRWSTAATLAWPRCSPVSPTRLRTPS